MSNDDRLDRALEAHQAGVSPSSIAAREAKEQAPRQEPTFTKPPPEPALTGRKFGDKGTFATSPRPGIATSGRQARPAFQTASEIAQEVDQADRRDARDALRVEFGDEYVANGRLMNQLLDRMSPEERERYETGLTADGKRLLNDPDTVRALAQQARSTPAVLKQAMQQSGLTERQQIEHWMKIPGSAPYYKGPDAERIQARYRDLLRETG